MEGMSPPPVRRIVIDAELAYVAWHEIADALAFKSVQADSENVRELVHRVRRKLGGVQADDLIESKRGVGYLGDVGELSQVPDVNARAAYKFAQVIVGHEPSQPPTVYQCDQYGEVIAVFD